jgi:P4 family phage/plasmid primase-like protien
MAQTYKRGEFCNYLQRYKVEKMSVFTHTSIVKPSGAFYIPTDEMDVFFTMYNRALLAGEDLYMTEKHRDIAPFLIDLDFRFEKTDNMQRRYTLEHVKQIIMIYISCIKEYIDIANTITIYLLEKPYLTTDKGMIKDGIHIIIPELVTKPSVQYLVRKDVIPQLKPLFESLECINDVEDIVDEAVIERNNWQMYGSKKPNCEPYDISKIYAYQANEDVLVEQNIDTENKGQYIEILSIRNKFDAVDIKIGKQHMLLQLEQDLQAKKRKTMQNNPALQSSRNNKKNVIENIEHVEKMIDVLSAQRANSYHDWIRVGWCLRNIDYRLLPKWIEFSKKSSKFVDGECERYWNHMRDDGLGIGTLYMWAKQDDPEAYKDIMENDISNLIYASRNETHYDIARVVHFMFKHEFVCASIKQNYWYQFRDNRWVPCDCGYTLHQKLSTDVFKQYNLASSKFSMKAAQTDDEGEQSRFAETSKKLSGITLKLKQVSFKENVMTECRRLFYTEKFDEKLDSRCNLIGFENGVYDLELKEFREGRPEDFISFTTGCNYVEYEPENPFARQIDTFLSQVLTKPHMKEYVLLLLASFLDGNIREERFHIWTGNGSNGKSRIIDLFEQSFGDYCCKFPVTMLTQKRVSTGSATSELARAKGKRFAVLQEPSEDEKLNVGLMKELSGGDKIQARALFKEPIEFKPQFKMVLTCNHLPNVPSDDGGTWRRIRLVEFTSKFTQNPNPENENEFPVDLELSMKFIDWREHFMALLIEYYKKYCTQGGIKEPEEVLACTREYQRNNDFYLEFVENELEKDEMAFLSVNDAYTVFKQWQKDNIPAFKIKKKEFLMGIDKNCGKRISFNKVEGWKGYKIRSMGGFSGGDIDDPLA